MLTLPGLLFARRGQLIAPSERAPIVTMYGLADPAAADQPRPPEFTLMPSELDGKVTFHRRILQRVSSPAGAAEPSGTCFLQLKRPVADGAQPMPEAAAFLGGWDGVLSASCWRSVVNTPHTDRQEVVHLRDTELILAELDVDDGRVLDLLAQAARQLPAWDASGYRQTFPPRVPAAHRPSSSTSPS